MMAGRLRRGHTATKLARQAFVLSRPPAMKVRPMRLAALLPWLLLTTPAAAQAGCWGTPGAGAVKLTVVSAGVRSAGGDIVVTLYPDVRARFLAKGGKFARVRTQAVAGMTAACFWVQPGYYPVAVYHDENRDHDFNRTLFMPREGFGFSNNPVIRLATPPFSTVRTRVGPGDTTIRIDLRYP